MSEGLAEQGTSTRKFYEHVARPEWGVAVLTWEGEGKRGYRFDDGKLRVFKEGYFHLMRQAEADRGQREALAAYVRRKPGERRAPARVPDADAITLADQIEYFRSNYPQGFAGEKWQSDHRKRSKRSLLRHRVPAIEHARTELTREKLDRWLTDGRADEAVDTLRKVLAKTDLVTAAQRKQLDDLQHWHAERLAKALRNLLWGQDSIRQRLGRWISAIAVATSSRSTTWALATAPLALVHPEEHVCVRYSSFSAQGASMVPPYDPGRVASPGDYEGAQAVARRVRDRLVEEGLSPEDMLDVYDFMWVTLRPKARKAIAARRVAARSGGRSKAQSTAGDEASDAERAAA